MNRDGSATVELLGTDLWSPGMLPDVTVGGIPVTAIRLGAAGELNGKLARRPRNDEVIVSIGSRGIHGRAVIVATPGRAGGPIWDRLGTLLAFLWSHLRLPRH